MECLEQMVDDNKAAGRELELTGLQGMIPISNHPHSARKSLVMAAPNFTKKPG